MISASDFRNGVTFEMDGKVMQVIEFHADGVTLQVTVDGKTYNLQAKIK